MQGKIKKKEGSEKMLYFIYLIAGLGAGVVTGLAGLSAAVVITPLLVGVCGWSGYDAVTVALASDVLASLISAYTYYKNGNIDMKRGTVVSLVAFAGAILGSYLGYLFSRVSEDGLGYLVMILNIFLGLKFIFKPITGGIKEAVQTENVLKTKKTLLAVILGFLIGVECGFMGSGGGVLMLSVFTMVLGYNLKIAVGTSTMVMTLVALTGAVSHVAMGASMELISGITIIVTCLLGAVVSAKYANRCDIKKLNHIVGMILIVLSVFTLSFNHQ